MRVITLNPSQFIDSCGMLAHAISSAGFSPGLIVGIRRGGEDVARNIAEYFPSARMAFVSLQRPSTGRKRKLASLVRPIIRIVPRIVLDMMRILEAKMLSGRKPRPLSHFLLPEALCNLGPVRILLVDDAVDSGHTMLSVAEALRRCNPEAELRTAALTVTTSRPLVIPDFKLYNDNTLIRFPWSMDARK